MKTKWKIEVDSRIAAEIEHRIMDPMLHKPRYGMRSKIINALLAKYLRENPIDIDDTSYAVDAEITKLIATPSEVITP